MTESQYKLPDLEQTDIWLIPLKNHEVDTRALLTLLDQQEQQRYKKMHSKLQMRYLLSHAALRQILAAYINIPAESICYTLNQHNKPALNQAAKLAFNLSHSHDLAAIAISTQSAIGIDIEFYKHKPEWLKIAKRFFTEAELHFLLAQPAADQNRAFLQLWTRKEAYIKGIGTGLSTSLKQFDCSQAPLVSALGKTDSISHWQLFDLQFNKADLTTDYLGCLALPTKKTEIKYHPYSFEHS